MCLATLALAEPVVDPQTDFSADLYTEGGRTCVVLPTEHGDCAGVATAQLRALPTPNSYTTVYVALVRFDTWRYVAILYRTEPTPEATEQDLAHVFADDSGVTRGRLSRVNGVQVIPIERPSADAGIFGVLDSHMTTRMLVTKRGMYLFSFVSDDAHAAALDDVVDRTLKTLKLEPASAPTSAPLLGRSSSSSFPSAVSAALLGVSAVAGVAWPILWWLGRHIKATSRRTKKQSKKRPKASQSPHRIAATVCGLAAIAAYVTNAYSGSSSFAVGLLGSFVVVGGIIATVYGIRGRLGPDSPKTKPPASPP